MTPPTSPALFSEGTCCAILGQVPVSEKSEAEEAQQDGEKGKMGGRGRSRGSSRAGCSQQMGGTKAPLVQPLRGLDGRVEGWQAGWLVNVQMNTAVLSHSSPNHV